MAKILLFDIETAPLTGCFWSMWKQNIGWNQLISDWYMLTWAAKWLDSDEVMYDSLHLHGNMKDDSPIVNSLWHLLDEADIVVAHNGNKFDIKKVNARFLQAGLVPPSPYRKVDTLLEAKKNFALTSNRLDAIGDTLGVGRKIDTGGFDLWARCMDGDKKAFEEMCEYNIQDIWLLQDVYVALRPWMNNHPNLGVYDDREEPVCPKCGGSHVQWRGDAVTQAGRYARFQCQDCGGWGRSRYTNLSPEKRKTLVTNAQ